MSDALVLFNNQAGRPSPSEISPPCGWEDGGLLSVHWTGHFMTALSQAYAEKGETVFKKKLDWMVAELASFQEAYTAQKNPTYSGYLGALPEDIVLRLSPPRFANYGTNLNTSTWAPWYTQHKIIRCILQHEQIPGSGSSNEDGPMSPSRAHDRRQVPTRLQGKSDQR
jgi:DUF1680 family protein